MRINGDHSWGFGGRLRWTHRKLPDAASGVSERALKFEQLESRQLLSVFSVANTLDSGPGSLRQAILDANASSGSDTIEFAIGGGGAQSLQPQSALPTIINPLVIDGTTQPGFAGSPIIQLTGIDAGASTHGLLITADDCVVRGLVINRFTGSGIFLEGSENCAIEGNFIGTDIPGTAALGNGTQGVVISNGARSNRIGTDGDGIADFAERNVISGNTSDGINIVGVGTDDNVVAGNFIGTDVTGTVTLGNGRHGVSIIDGPQGNRIGTDGDGIADAAERNVISGNTSDGIHIVGVGTDDNVVAGNFVGTDVAGTVALGNGRHGVTLIAGARNNRVGTNGDGISDTAERNVISGNAEDGVPIHGVGTNSNIVAGNFIGTDITGTKALGNGRSGVTSVLGAQENRIGTNGDGIADEAERNVISANAGAGITIYAAGSDANIVAGNFIGTDSTGTIALGNGTHGVTIVAGAQSNRVGTNGDGIGDTAERNVISGNAHHGVQITDAGTDNNVVAGNYIGTDVSGSVALGNGFGVEWGYGIWIAYGAQTNLIGTNGDGMADTAERNLISANHRHGLVIQTANTDENVVAGNYIGTDATGSKPLGNGDGGVYIGNWNGAPQSNRIGTDGNGIADEMEGNLISANGRNGVAINGKETSHNVVAGNLIGTDVTGTSALGNASDGVALTSGANFNRIGTNGDGIGDLAERNIISGNISNGVVIIRPGSDLNVVAGNYIGTDVTGTKAIGNQARGVVIELGASGNTLGGTVSEARNVISGNGRHGVSLYSNLDKANTIIGNFIGTNADGSQELGNQLNGIHVGNASGNVIGGEARDARNLISGNQGHGIQISGTQAAVFHWSAGDGGNDHYYIVSPSMSWHTAEGAAIMLEGHLASITSEEEQDFIDNTILSDNAFSTEGLWIGLNDEHVEGTFEWASGEPVSFTNWHFGQPDNLAADSSNADFAAVNTLSSEPAGKGTWADETPWHWLRGIIEVETEPDSAALEAIFGANNNLVRSNVITGNFGAGVRIGGTSTFGNSILGNSISSNGGLGVDLSGGSEDANGVTTNDVADTDDGPNRLQNYPDLISAAAGVFTTVEGSLGSEPNTPYRIEFSRAGGLDPSGHGEGATFLTSTEMTTDASGHGEFLVPLPASLSLGAFVTSTATNLLTGDTSEFSNGVAVENLGLVGLRGTEGNDTLEVFTGPGPGEWTVKLNGVVQDIVDGTDTLVFDGLGGYDTANLVTLASNENDIAEIWPDHGTLSSGGVTTTMTDVESISIDGRGGEDTVVLHDSPGDDTITARAVTSYQPVTSITMTDFDFDDPSYASTYSHALTNFEILTAYSTAGIDVASFYDSDGDDEFIGRGSETTLSGEGFNFRAEDFTITHGYAKAEGDDRAELYDTPRNDRFKASPTYARMFKGIYQRRARFYETVVAYADSGGASDHDDARLFDSNSADQFIGTPTESRLYSDSAGYDITVVAFDSVLARASNLSDIATFIGGSGNDLLAHKWLRADTLVKSPKTEMMDNDDPKNPGSAYSITARRFNYTTAIGGQGGFDIAKLWDTLDDDHFTTSGDTAAMYCPDTELLYDAVAFDKVVFNHVFGGDDTVDEDSHDFILSQYWAP